MDKLRVVVTGHNGFIGSRVVRRLVSEHEVVGYGRKEGGLADYAAVKKFIATVSPDVVIHCAANGDIGDCERDKDNAYTVNVLGTRNVASACNLAGSWLVNLSSDQVYNPSGGLLSELVPTEPQNFYGQTKVWGEQEVRDLVREHHILRISWHYDWKEPGMPGTRGGILESFAATLEKGDPIRASVLNRRHVTYIEDLVDVIVKMINGDVPFGTYNIASEHDLTDYEMARRILLAGGVPESALVDYLVPVHHDKVTSDMRTEPYHLKRLGIGMPTFEEGLQRCMEKFGPIFRDLID